MHFSQNYQQLNTVSKPAPQKYKWLWFENMDQSCGQMNEL